MSKFYNPYHFVPVVERTNHTEDISVKDFEEGKGDKLKQVTHDRYKKELYSGRLICRLTTEGPIFIGSERNKDTHEVKPFELEEGIPALPASSLRGMISSIAEAASNSAFRILEDMHYSRRMEAREGNEVNNLGILIKDGDILKLLPLEKGDVVKVDGYTKVNSNPPKLKLETGSFLDNASLRSYSPNNREFWYKNKTSYKFIMQPEYEDLPVTQQEDYIRGIFRILGIQGRGENIPTNKKHEYFIPYPEGIENNPKLNAQNAIDKFHKLADERTDKDSKFKLPFELKGSDRNSDHEKYGDKIRLREGDIVFYKPDTTGKNVEELMISAIWRRKIKGTSYDFFKNIPNTPNNSKEFLPFNEGREKITIAEQMFGFVEKRDNDEEGQPDSGKRKSGLALAGRLRFSFGKLSSKTGRASFYEDKVLLKILDSPKPPCPTLYFKNKQGKTDYIGKTQLTLGKHIPQGRKFYLHHNDINSKPWKTDLKHEKDDLSQKSWITPIKQNSIFYFHIDFNNLSKQELGLLCYAVRPTEEFRHKFGMGKPLGLGQVKIDPIGLLFIDRSERYTNTTDLFNASRYHSCWVQKGEVIEGWPEEYQRERQEAQKGLKEGKDFDAIRNVFEPHPDIKTALELLGNPRNINKSVCYPQIEKSDPEQELFQWFGENEKLIAEKEKLKRKNQSHNHIKPEHLCPLNKDSNDFNLAALNELKKT